MIDSRAWASAPSPSVHTPSSSGPRCRRVPIIAHNRASISARARAGCDSMNPAMPHIAMQANPSPAVRERGYRRWRWLSPSRLHHALGGKPAAGAGVSGVDDERAVLDEEPVIDGVVVGADDHGIERGGSRFA